MQGHQLLNNKHRRHETQENVMHSGREAIHVVGVVGAARTLGVAGCKCKEPDDMCYV